MKATSPGQGTHPVLLHAVDSGQASNTITNCVLWRWSSSCLLYLTFCDRDHHPNAYTNPVAQAWNLALFGNNRFFAFCISSRGIDEILPGWELTSGLERNHQNHLANQHIRSVENNFTSVDISAVKHVQTDVLHIDNGLKESSPYDPVCLSGHPSVPGDRFVRWGWFENMAFSIPISHYNFHQGNYNGNLQFVWKTLPGDSSDC